MDAEKKETTNENPEEKPQPNDKNDNINNKVYKYYLWEKNRKPDDKVYVISKDNLLKLKNYIKYDDLKSFIKGDNQLLDKINDFYKDNKIDLKSSEENKKIKIEIKEKKDKSPNENEEEINEDVVDLIQSLGYNIENDNGEKNLDKNDTKQKENEDKKKDNEEGKIIESRKEDKVENNGQDKKEEKDNDGKNDIENKEIKKEKEIQGEKKDENENKEVKNEEKKEEKIIDEKKEEKKEEEKKEEVKKEEKKEDEKKDEEKEKEKEKEQIKEEKKEDEKKEEEKKEEMKDEKKEEGNKDDINKEKIDDKKTEIQDLKKEEINKEENKEEQSKENPKNEGQTQNAESEPGKETLQKKEEIQNPEAQNDSTKKEVIDNKEKANPPKSKSNTEEKQEETDEHKIKENIIDYDEKEKKDSEGQTKEEKKDDKTRKKSDITDKIINNNENEKLIKDEEKEKILLQKKRNIEKEISKESDKDSKEEEPKKDVNEIVEKKEEEKDINTDNKEIQTNEINNTNNQENNNNMNNANNNMPNPEMTLQMMQFQEMMMKKYFVEHGAENSFLNNYYQNTITENNDPDDGLPQVVNGRIKLKSDIPSLGLQNVGATCYMNATLQCLIHIKELSEQLLSAFFFKYPRENKDYAEKHKLTNQFVTLLSQVYFPKLNGNPNKYYAPYDFKNLISEINPLFAGYAANDAKDLLQCLLENMHQELKQATQVFFDYNIDQKNEQMGMQYFYNSYITQNKSPINDFLYGVNEMKTTCTICKITKYNFQCYNLLYFPLKEAKRFTVLKKKEEDKNFDEKNYILTLEDCFYHFEHIDYFTGDNQMYCSDCKKEADAEYQTVLFTTPTILSIVLNRGRANKDFKEDFKFGVDLDIKKYIHNQFFKHGKYYLIGMVVHSGESSLAGHFFAYCRMDKNAKWFCYNDAFVDEVTNIEEKLKENKPYILFYHYDNDEK